MEHGKVLVSRPVVVRLVEDDPIRRDSVNGGDSLHCQLVLGEVLLGSGDKGIDHCVLTELRLNLLLVGLEGLVDSSVSGSQGCIPLEHNAVASCQRNDGRRTKNQGGGIKLRQLSGHSGVEDHLVVKGILVLELAGLVSLMDLDEECCLLSDGLLDIQRGLGCENCGADEPSGPGSG